MLPVPAFTWQFLPELKEKHARIAGCQLPICLVLGVFNLNQSKKAIFFILQKFF